MVKIPPSIFNDVIGPVMRGSSSSHVAASYRIGDAVRQSIGGVPAKVVTDFDAHGSLAANYDGQGADMGFVCGLLGKPLVEPGVEGFARLAHDAGLEFEFRVLEYGAVHPNNYRIEAVSRDGTARRWQALSVGGGMFEMREYDGFPVRICGDFDEVLIKFADDPDGEKAKDTFARCPEADFTEIVRREGASLLSLKYSCELEENEITAAAQRYGAPDIAVIRHILPTRSSAGCTAPFLTAEAAMAANSGKGLPMWRLAVMYEAMRGGSSEEEVLRTMDGLVAVMENSLNEGLRLSGTEYEDKILPPQARLIEPAQKLGKLVPGDVLNEIIASVAAIMEAKSSMKIIVAAPTAGSCGCLPGTLIGAARAMKKTREELIRAMFAAGLVGLFIAESATFAAEIGGCQVECGAGSGMAAAGLVELMGGSAVQCCDAAAMALQNVTGLACDAIAKRVEVPCLGKNIMGASNAVVCANMALAGFDKVLPLDETIAALYDVGRQLPPELRCTHGGLAKCFTAEKIYVALEKKKQRKKL